MLRLQTESAVGWMCIFIVKPKINMTFLARRAMNCPTTNVYLLANKCILILSITIFLKFTIKANELFGT